jgi:hypothetical protein
MGGGGKYVSMYKKNLPFFMLIKIKPISAPVSIIASFFRLQFRLGLFLSFAISSNFLNLFAKAYSWNLRSEFINPDLQFDA